MANLDLFELVLILALAYAWWSASKITDTVVAAKIKVANMIVLIIAALLLISALGAGGQTLDSADDPNFSVNPMNMDALEVIYIAGLAYAAYIYYKAGVMTNAALVAGAAVYLVYEAMDVNTTF